MAHVEPGDAQEELREQTRREFTFDPARLLTIAADSLDRLRRVDVFRLLDAARGAENRQAMADYIRGGRPDLGAEVADCLAELSGGQP